MSDYVIFKGEYIDSLREIDDESIDSIVCDPPYAIEFMSEKWDSWSTPEAFQMWCKEWATEALRVLRPGGYLVAFGGTRTYHRLASGIEDAGFEIRDSLMWLYGTGFPKSMNVSKAIDKAAGAEREVVGYDSSRSRPNRLYEGGALGNVGGTGKVSDRTDNGATITAPATPEAKQWDGWGTALKPAYEPIVMARKPLEGTVVKNVLAHGTGAINIDACRIDYQDAEDQASAIPQGRATAKTGALAGKTQNDRERSEFEAKNDKGRFPANVILSHHPDCQLVGSAIIKGRVINRWDDGAKPFGGGAGHDFTGEQFPDDEVPVYQCVPDCPVADLDAQSGTSKSSGGRTANISKTSKIYGGGKGLGQDIDAEDVKGDPGYGDTGGASRFFYCPKASKKERGEGNDHPTVKPIPLMRWLVKMITPPSGIVLDPFMGSGTTGIAAIKEGFFFVGCEMKDHYIEISEKRMEEIEAQTVEA